MWGGRDDGDDSNGLGFGRRECERGRRTKKKKVIVHGLNGTGLLKEPRACVTTRLWKRSVISATCNDSRGGCPVPENIEQNWMPHQLDDEQEFSDPFRSFWGKQAGLAKYFDSGNRASIRSSNRSRSSICKSKSKSKWFFWCPFLALYSVSRSKWGVYGV